MSEIDMPPPLVTFQTFFKTLAEVVETDNVDYFENKIMNNESYEFYFESYEGKVTRIIKNKKGKVVNSIKAFYKYRFYLKHITTLKIIAMISKNKDKTNHLLSLGNYETLLLCFKLIQKRKSDEIIWLFDNKHFKKYNFIDEYIHEFPSDQRMIYNTPLDIYVCLLEQSEIYKNQILITRFFDVLKHHFNNNDKDLFVCYGMTYRDEFNTHDTLFRRYIFGQLFKNNKSDLTKQFIHYLKFNKKVKYDTFNEFLSPRLNIFAKELVYSLLENKGQIDKRIFEMKELKSVCTHENMIFLDSLFLPEKDNKREFKPEFSKFLDKFYSNCEFKFNSTICGSYFVELINLELSIKYFEIDNSDILDKTCLLTMISEFIFS